MSNWLDAFQSFRRILCVCPHCGEIVRFSDLQLRYLGKAPKTWLDKYESDIVAMQKKEQAFEEKEQQLRDASVERGRKKVPQLVQKCLCPEFKKLTYDPYDIKALMHPVDFVVFDGLNRAKMENVVFLTRKPFDKERNLMLQSIQKTVDAKKYDWKVARVLTDGQVNFE